MKRISIVIVNWKGIRDTIACLASIRKLDNKKMSVSVIVVDNGSDHDASVIRRAHPWVEVIETGENLGFAGGMNAGIRVALQKRADMVWLLNNDTIVERRALSLVDVFDDPRIGIAGSKIYFAKGHEFHYDRYTQHERGRVLWYAGGIIDWDNMYASHRGVDQVDGGQYDVTEGTAFVTGCSMMVRSDVFAVAGLFDEKYFLYLEDVDFCLRTVRAGYGLQYVPTSVVWHLNAGSSGRPGNPVHEYYFTRNRLLIGMRFAPFRTRLALWREGLRFIIEGPKLKRKAVLDAMLCRYGNQYEPETRKH